MRFLLVTAQIVQCRSSNRELLDQRRDQQKDHNQNKPTPHVKVPYVRTTVRIELRSNGAGE